MRESLDTQLQLPGLEVGPSGSDTPVTVELTLSVSMDWENRTQPISARVMMSKGFWLNLIRLMLILAKHSGDIRNLLGL